MTAKAPGTTKAVIKADYYDENYYEHSLEGFFDIIVKAIRKALITYKLGGGTYNGSTADVVEEHDIGDAISILGAPDNEPGGEPGGKPDSKPGSNPGNKPGIEPDSNPGNNPGSNAQETVHTDDASGVVNTKSNVSGVAPKVGDDSNAAGWLLVMLIACIMVLQLKARNRC